MTQTQASPAQASVSTLSTFMEPASHLPWAGLSLGFRDKRQAGFRVPNTSGAQSGEAKQLLRCRMPESKGKKMQESWG